MGRLGFTWGLMKASLGVLRQDKQLLLFAVLSGFCCLVVLASFAVPLVMMTMGQDAEVAVEVTESDQQMRQIMYYVGLFLFYFCNYFVIVFFNSAIITCAIIRMKGGEPTLGDGFRAAFSRLPQIFGWALVSATVGMILRLIEERFEKVGRIVAGLLGMAWTVTTFLVVPVLVVEKKGPIAAAKESVALLKKTWGQQLVGNFGFGLLFFLLGLIGVGIAAIGFVIGTPIAMYIFIGLAVLYFILLALMQSTLAAIFQAAVYLYAREGQVGGGFDENALRGAYRQKGGAFN